MEHTETKYYFSPDLYLSAALVLLLNLQPEFKLANGKILFGFPITDVLCRAMAEYAGVRRSMEKTGVYHA